MLSFGIATLLSAAASALVPPTTAAPTAAPSSSPSRVIPRTYRRSDRSDAGNPKECRSEQDPEHHAPEGSQPALVLDAIAGVVKADGVFLGVVVASDY